VAASSDVDPVADWESDPLSVVDPPLPEDMLAAPGSPSAIESCSESELPWSLPHATPITSDAHAHRI
jgi:hypothetical protein